MKTAIKFLSAGIAIFITIGNLNAQITFKRFYSGAFIYNFDEIYQIDSLYHLIGQSHFILDSLGQATNNPKIDYQTTVGDFLGFPKSLCKNNNFYITGISFSAPYPELHKIDMTSNVLWAKSCITTSALNDNTRLYRTSRNGFFICSREQNIGGIIYDLDSLGSLNRRYAINILNSRAMYIDELPDATVISGLQIPNLGTCFARFDTTGNVLWAKSIFRNNVFSNIVNNNNGTYSFLSSKDSLGFPLSPPTSLCTIDTSGNVVWAKEYNYFLGNAFSLSGSKIISTSDAGYLIFSSVLNSGKTDVLLVKTDANGDTLWTRTHGNNSSSEGGGSIIQTTDGGYLISSYSDAYPAQSNGGLYLIKTDSLGHTSTLCQEGSYPVPVNVVFPNDSNITLTVTIDSIGQMPITIAADTAFYYSLNGCALTGVNDGYTNRNKSIKAYPNPATQNITLELPQTPKIEDYYTVYDSLGKIVLQRPLKNMQQQVDVSKLSKGFYTIKVIQGKSVSYSKVVVE